MVAYMALKPEAFRARREQILLRLLLRVTRAMTVETVERIRARGHGEMQLSFPRLLGNLDTEGTRIGALARRMGTSRQAVSQLLQEVEAAGLVERRADPKDRRGVVILFTPHGRKVLADAVEVMTGIEGDYASLIGKEGLARLKRTLKQLLDKVDRPGTFGMD
jgi:DNA-binding MarR family transcriptional regulator